MIQLYLDDRLMIGLTKKNIEKLQAKQPIDIDVRMKVKKLTIIYGDTKAEMIEDIERAGLQLPDAVKQSLIDSPE